MISEARRLASETNSNGLNTIYGFIISDQDGKVNLSHEDRVLRFWANSAGNDYITTDLIMLGLVVCFGAIHCIAWHFSFLTHADLSIWRISTVTMMVVPFYIPLMFLLAGWLDDMDFDIAYVIIAPIAGFSLFPAFIFYILAWVFTLALAFTSLRDLPHGAFDTVHWTTFIPHV